MIKRDFQNLNAFNLDKRAPIGYNDPISRARLIVNIMLTIMKHLDRIHKYTEPYHHVKVCLTVG